LIPICLQLSQESPQIFRLLHRINIAQTPDELRQSFKNSTLTKEDFDAFFIYSSGIDIF
jgi:dipeptidyl-peptidase-3